MEDHRQPVHRFERLRVVLAQDVTSDTQHLPVQPLRLVALVLFGEGGGQILHRLQRVAMALSECLAVALQGLAVELFCFRQCLLGSGYAVNQRV